jgi:hypothetical protein
LKLLPRRHPQSMRPLTWYTFRMGDPQFWTVTACRWLVSSYDSPHPYSALCLYQPLHRSSLALTRDSHCRHLQLQLRDVSFLSRSSASCQSPTSLWKPDDFCLTLSNSYYLTTVNGYQLPLLFIQNSEVNDVWNVNHNPQGNYKIECRASRTSDKCEGRIRCHGGVSILCWPVTPAVCP